MGGNKTDDGESELRDRKKTRNPDATVRVDDEKDDLYSDGLDVEDDTPPLVEMLVRIGLNENEGFLSLLHNRRGRQNQFSRA